MNRLQTFRQRGMALIVGLILLALMTVMAMTSFNIGRTSMDVVGNLQHHNEVVTAANSAIQEAMSSTAMFDTPSNVFLAPCNGNNTKCYDMNGDGTNDITVTLTPAPTCVQAQVVPNGALDPVLQAGCFREPCPTCFGMDVPTADSLCGNSIWEINAQAVDAITETSVTVTEGAGIIVAATAITTSCP